ncbi:hypothetical protein Tco_0618737 [Tanacetum coccineum]
MTGDCVSGEVCELLQMVQLVHQLVRGSEPVEVSGSESTSINIGEIYYRLGDQNFMSTQEFIYEISELRAISGHILGAAGVIIPENNLDDLHSSREEDGTSETIDPQDLLGSLLLADVSVSRAVGFLRGTSAVVVILVKGHVFPTIVNFRPVGLQVYSIFVNTFPVGF